MFSLAGNKSCNKTTQKQSPPSQTSTRAAISGLNSSKTLSVARLMPASDESLRHNCSRKNRWMLGIWRYKGDKEPVITVKISLGETKSQFATAKSPAAANHLNCSCSDTSISKSTRRCSPWTYGVWVKFWTSTFRPFSSGPRTSKFWKDKRGSNSSRLKCALYKIRHHLQKTSSFDAFENLPFLGVLRILSPMSLDDFLMVLVASKQRR